MAPEAQKPWRWCCLPPGAATRPEGQVIPGVRQIMLGLLLVSSLQSVCMYVCMHVCTYVYDARICVYIYIDMYMCVCACGMSSLDLAQLSAT